ncbi:MAG: hypothetical protein POH28_12545 [Acidocella sp.]|nr:hypothetical protein [Acidocella sp.]
MVALIVIVLGLAGFGLLISMRKPKTAPSAEKIISDYVAFVERHNPSPLRIDDVAVLPHSKDVILSALLHAVAPDDDKRNDFLMSGAIYLAQFQPGVGSEPLYKDGFDLTANLRQQTATNDLTAVKAEIKAMAAKVEKFKEQAKRFEVFSALVEQDISLMMARFKAAMHKT